MSGQSGTCPSVGRRAAVAFVALRPAKALALMPQCRPPLPRSSALAEGASQKRDTSGAEGAIADAWKALPGPWVRIGVREVRRAALPRTLEADCGVGGKVIER